VGEKERGGFCDQKKGKNLKIFLRPICVVRTGIEKLTREKLERKVESGTGQVTDSVFRNGNQVPKGKTWLEKQGIKAANGKAGKRQGSSVSFP